MVLHSVLTDSSGNAINKLPGLQLSIISDSTTQDLYRGIREHLTSLIPGLTPTDLSTMSLGLSHSLSRHKLKFSADKVDTMIVQAIALLDDLDKELNTYAMRVKEWYGWHFPEMQKIINDNMAYARCILTMGMRTNAANTDFSEVLPEELETALKAAAEVSMGTEITEIDLSNIKALAEQVISFAEYRQQLSGYLSARMNAIAPNLTALVGELVGARLIAHAGSLISLSKAPASTLQILGAEKALFRALKTKHNTPKYGLIYHASLVGQAGKAKGKISRMLAAKASLGTRYDAYNEDKPEGESEGALGAEYRRKVEARLRHLEGRPPLPKEERYIQTGVGRPGKAALKETKNYNADADTVMTDAPVEQALGSAIAMDIDGESEEKEDAEESSKKKRKAEKEEKKSKKEKRRKSEAGEDKEKKKEKKEKKEKGDKEKKKKRKKDESD